MSEFDFLDAAIWGTVDKVEGWLNYSAAHFTWSLIKHQAELPVSVIIEFGIYKAKYLSLIAAASAKSRKKIIGYDGFFESYGKEISVEHIEFVRNMMLSNVSTVIDAAGRLKVIRSNTLRLTAQDLSKKSVLRFLLQV